MTWTGIVWARKSQGNQIEGTCLRKTKIHGAQIPTVASPNVERISEGKKTKLPPGDAR